MFSFKKILKQAYEITLKYKFLWIFGLFLVFGNVLNVVFNFQDEINFSQVGVNWPPSQWNSITSTAFFLLSVLLVLMFFRSKVAMIIGIKAINDKQETSASKSFKYSRLFFSRVLGSMLLVELVLFVLSLVLIGPIVFMFAHHFYYRGGALLVLGLMIFLPVLVICDLLNVLTPLFIVVYDLKIKEAITRSLDLIASQWVVLVGLAVILFFIELLAFFILSPIVFLVNLPYHMVGLVLVIIVGLAFIILQTVLSVFTQSVWVLAFLDLVKPQKIEDEEVVPAAEII